MCVSLKPQIFIVKYFMFFTCSVPNMEKICEMPSHLIDHSYSRRELTMSGSSTNVTKRLTGASTERALSWCCCPVRQEPQSPACHISSGECSFIECLHLSTPLIWPL